VAKTKRGRGKERSKKETRRKGREKRKTKKQKKARTIDVKRVAEKWEILNEEKEAAKSETEAKKLVLEKFHK